MVTLINGLNIDYSQVQVNLEYQLESTTEPLTVDKLKVHLRARYNRIRKSSSEVALNTRVTDKVCWICGDVGHISRYCNSNKMKGKSYSKRTGKYCTYCKKKGHNINTCFKKNDSDFTSPESGNLVGDTSRRIVLLGSDNEKSMENEWICDSGAIHHITTDPMEI